MNRIDIDFSGHVSWARKLGWAVLAIGVLSLALVAWRHFSVKAELESAKETHQLLLADLEERSALAMTADKSGDKEQAGTAAAKNIPWDALFRSLEQAAGEDIALLEFEPDAEEREIRLVGEARNLSAMLAYLERLQKTPSVAEVRILSHQEQTQDPQRPVRFEMGAEWRWGK